MTKQPNNGSSHPTVSRRGSALLIVLGMLSFMVVSAVGFSIYMRQSRVPSSHLRREATARYLLKSALANAVDRLNGSFNTTYNRVEGVYDDPYPGLNDLMVEYNGDYWVNRVFTPFGQVDASETVSTLTLEGLGYIPPAIINEVRVRSRTTRTAKWTNLAYDLGRYAFCAVDVSDCFDINKLKNVTRRTSHAGERISLSALYPDDPDTLVNLLKSKANDSEPFVSIGDFNVAVGKSDYTPFVRYINDQNGDMYLEEDEAVSNALFITDTWFPPTNGYLTAELELKSAAQNASTHYDLSGKEGQPWKESDFGKPSFVNIPCSSAGLAKDMLENLGGVGLTCLYDYLDEDRVPMTLALPTVEAVPMVCGVNLAGSLKLQFEETSDSYPAADPNGSWTYTDADGRERSIKRTVRTVVFRGANLTQSKLFVHGTVMFPFKRMKSDNRADQTYKVEVLAALFYGIDDLKCRLDNDSFRPTKDDWQNGAVRDGIVFYKGGADVVGQVSALAKKDIEKTDEAFAEFSCPLQAASGNVSMPAFYIVDEKDETPAPADGTPLTPLPEGLLETEKITVDGTKNMNNAFRLFGRSGGIEGDVAEELTNLREQGPELFTASKRQDKNGSAETLQKSATVSGSYRPYLTVWVRVVNGDGDAVDLVPATCKDDANHISGCQYPSSVVDREQLAPSLCGPGVPLLDFKDTRTEVAFKFSKSLPDDLAQQSFDPQGWKSLYAVDPRYNFAPEDWIGSQDIDANPDKWRSLMSGVFNSSVGGIRRDRDIFMFTSDQEHLQSVGELQFLPYVQSLGSGKQSMFQCGFQGVNRYHGRNDFGSRTGPTSDGLANRDYFWRTYDGFGDEGTNPYYDLKSGGSGAALTVVNGSGDFRVNPLSNDERILATAVADTPWDYYVASTNEATNKSAVKNAPENYAFGSAAKIASDRWEDKTVSSVARAMRNAFRDKARSSTGAFDWGIPYEDLWADQSDTGNGTGDDQTKLFDVDLESGHPLHGVDRKYLFSYWRECFQNRQHLFLVFLRAEPLTVGGAGGDSLANSQLGARGVALVWRDPAPPTPTSGSMDRKARGSLTSQDDWRNQYETQPPHRTRVLFYHQFD